MSRPPSSDESDKEDQLVKAIIAYDESITRQESVSPPSVDPELATRLQQDCKIIDKLAKLRKSPRLGQVNSTVIASDRFQQFGRFRIIRPLGSGGHGVVYLADDPLLARRVALKVPRPEVLTRSDMRSRFLREARVAAVLSHPNIVSVYDAAQEGVICYIASEYIPGPTLARWRAASPCKLSPRTVAEIVAKLADAIGYAHRRGVIHRDLKPSNILLFGAFIPNSESMLDLDEDVQQSHLFDPITPKITDFGIAKLLDNSGQKTRGGQIIGTPEYMSPEQAQGKAELIGPQTDVYSLGSILYWLLTDHSPFQGANRKETLRKVQNDPYPGLRVHRNDVPRDLAAITARCLEKDLTKRYVDGSDLAADLTRFLEGRPTEARPISWPEKTWKWSKRHPSAALLILLLSSLLIAFAWIESNAARKVMRDKSQMQEQLDDNKITQDNMLSRQWLQNLDAYLGEMRFVGNKYLQDGLITSQQVHSWDPDPERDQFDMRGWEWRYLKRKAQACIVTPVQNSVVEKIVAAGDSRTFASQSADELVIWNACADQKKSTYPLSSDRFKLVGASDYRIVLEVNYGDGKYAVRLADAFNHSTVFENPLDKGGRLQAVAFSSDNQQLALQLGNQTQILDAKNGSILQQWQHESVFEHVSFAADLKSFMGREIAPQNPQRFCHVKLEKDRNTVSDLPRGLAPNECSTLSWNGQFFAVFSPTTVQVEVWDTQSREMRFRTPFPNVQKAVLEFQPNNRLMVAGICEGELCHNVVIGSWSPVDPWKQYEISPNCRMVTAAFACQGKKLIVGCVDRTIRNLSIPPESRNRNWVAHVNKRECWALAPSPSGDSLISAGDDGTICFWDSNTLQKKFDFVGHVKDREPILVTSVQYAPDGNHFISTGFDNCARIWNVATCREGPRFTLTQQERVRSASYSPSGDLVATTCDDGSVSIWNAKDGSIVHQFRGVKQRIRMVTFVNEKILVSVGEDDTLRWMDVESRQPMFEIKDLSQPYCFALYSETDTLAVGTWDGYVVLRDAFSGVEKRRSFGSNSRIISITYSRDGKTIVTGSRDGSVRLWRAYDAQEIMLLSAGGPQVNQVVFGPGDQTLYATRHDGTVSYWTIKED